MKRRKRRKTRSCCQRRNASHGVCVRRSSVLLALRKTPLSSAAGRSWLGASKQVFKRRAQVPLSSSLSPPRVHMCVCVFPLWLVALQASSFLKSPAGREEEPERGLNLLCPPHASSQSSHRTRLSRRKAGVSEVLSASVQPTEFGVEVLFVLGFFSSGSIDKRDNLPFA